MTLAGDTDDIISVWGEVVTVVRNFPTYGNAGFGVNVWTDVIATVAEIQRIAGNNPTRDLGQGRFSSHAIFLPDGTGIIQGDRIRSSEWTTGKAEFEVQAVFVEDGHVEVRTRLVRSSVIFLMLENSEWILLETGKEINLE
jgi:hypothetical protein